MHPSANPRSAAAANLGADAIAVVHSDASVSMDGSARGDICDLRGNCACSRAIAPQGLASERLALDAQCPGRALRARLPVVSALRAELPPQLPAAARVTAVACPRLFIDASRVVVVAVVRGRWLCGIGRRLRLRGRGVRRLFGLV